MLSIFSALSSDPDKIRYSRSAHSAVDICAVLLNFSYACKQNYIYACTVKLWRSESKERLCEGCELRHAVRL